MRNVFTYISFIEEYRKETRNEFHNKDDGNAVTEYFIDPLSTSLQEKQKH